MQPIATAELKTSVSLNVPVVKTHFTKKQRFRKCHRVLGDDFFSERLLFFDPSGPPYIPQALAVQTHVSHPCFEPDSQRLPNQPYYCRLHV